MSSPTDIPLLGGSPTANAAVIEVSEASFQTEVVDRSMQVPVVIDCWAEWCAPCRQLTPVLERLALEAQGAWVLAKIDVDANPRIAQALGVSGIPAVKAIVGGQVVSEFTGALPEARVREWLAQLGVDAGAGAAPGAPPAHPGLAAAQQAELRSDFAAAKVAYDAVLADEPANIDAKAGRARAALVERAATADEAALRSRLGVDPLDVAAATGLADLEFLNGDPTAAFDRLIDLVRRTADDERDLVREHLLELFATLPTDDARVVAGRRSLANALF